MLRDGTAEIVVACNGVDLNTLVSGQLPYLLAPRLGHIKGITVGSLPVDFDILLKQHHRAGPSIHQEADRGEPRFPFGGGRLQNDRRLRGEAMHAIRKGQIRWVGKADPVGQRQLIHTIFGVAA
jgi:hypothetical protein